MKRFLTLLSVSIVALSLISFNPLVEGSPGYTKVAGVFQPVQVVWQDDPLYPDAALPMVCNKNTFLFGTLQDYDGDRFTIDIYVQDMDEPPGVDYFAIEISVSPPRPGIVIYVSPRFEVPKGGSKIVYLPAPLPIQPFQFIAGPGSYVISLRTIETFSINAITVPVKVVDTKPLRLLYYPLAFLGDTEEPDVTLPVPPPNQAVGAPPLDNMVKESNAFALGVYPIKEPEWGGLLYEKFPMLWLRPNPPAFSDEKVAVTHFLDTMKFFDQLGALLQGRFAQPTQAVVVVPDYFYHADRVWAKRWRYSIALGPSPGGALSPCGMPNVVYVELGYWQTVTHEITHNILNVKENRGHSDNKANGYWVNRKIPQVNKLDIMKALPFPDVLVFHEDNDLRWIKKRAADSDPTTVQDIPSSYENLLNFFRVGPDPEVLMVSGQIFRNGTVALDDWYRFPEGLPNLELGTTGNYSVVMLNPIGQELGRAGFNATFIFEASDLEPPKLVEVDVNPFIFIIPWISGTSVVQIRNATEHIVASRYVSANPPSVTMTFPNGGEIFTTGTYNLTWTAEDLDGDPLTYALLLSDDNGTNWLPFAIGLEGTSYALNVTGFPSGSNYLVKVIATDGVNTREDTSDSAFVISAGIHDVSILDVTPSRTVVGQGFNLPINVTVQNQGDYIENFNVTLYANTTVIQTQTVSLTSGGSITIIFTWNTTGFAKGNYTISAYAIPVLGETDTTDNTYVDGIVQITVDSTPPTTTISLSGVLGNNGWFTSVVAVTLSATDDIAGVNKTRYSFDNITWTNYAMPFTITNEGNTVIYYKSTDKAGNVEATKTKTIKIDKTAPLGSIDINNRDVYTTSTSVTLALTATDVTSGVAYMRFSHDNTSWTPWESYFTSKSWALTTGDETKTVYVQFKDNAGLISLSYFDAIVLDTTAPTIRITSPSPGHEIRSSTVTVTWTGSDETSGISHYEIRLDGDSWTKVGADIARTFTGLGDGSHTIDIKATDKAGNTKQDTVNFTVNTSPLFGPGYMEEAAILATIIIALGTAVYLLKIRKRS